MKTKKLVSFALALSLAFVPVALAGCSSGGGEGGDGGKLGGEPQQEEQVEQVEEVVTVTPEEALETTQLSWGGYTMGVDCVTADPERMASSELSGQGIRITFRYESGGNTGGFDGNQVFDLLESSPIVLKDADGNEYTYNGGVTDIMLVFSGNSLSIAEDMPRFGIIFDVPAGTDLSDYTLSVGDGNDLVLVEFITPEYAEYIAE